jgi:hypothetical protein
MEGWQSATCWGGFINAPAAAVPHFFTIFHYRLPHKIICRSLGCGRLFLLRLFFYQIDLFDFPVSPDLKRLNLARAE